jgi:microcystin-dependent protein
MTEPFTGQIQPFGFGFAPRNWAQCTGQILSIQQNTALFALLGTQYGGNGTTTFGLPDLQSRVPVDGERFVALAIKCERAHARVGRTACWRDLSPTRGG